LIQLGSLPAFAESPVRKGGDECEKGIRHSLGEGGSASAGSAEDVKMPRAEARGASLLARRTAGGPALLNFPKGTLFNSARRSEKASKPSLI